MRYFEPAGIESSISLSTVDFRGLNPAIEWDIRALPGSAPEWDRLPSPAATRGPSPRPGIAQLALALVVVAVGAACTGAQVLNRRRKRRAMHGARWP